MHARCAHVTQLDSKSLFLVAAGAFGWALNDKINKPLGARVGRGSDRGGFFTQPKFEAPDQPNCLLRA